MKIYWGTKRRGKMTGKGIRIVPEGGYGFFHIMEWRFWGLSLNRKFFGLIIRIDK